jgi:hypothetical protein
VNREATRKGAAASLSYTASARDIDVAMNCGLEALLW